MNKFTYSGKLSSRTISTEEEVLIWDISSHLSQWNGHRTQLKSPEFCFGDVTWYLFAKFHPQSILFGIDVEQRSFSVEEFDCCCNISCENFNGEVYKSFELKFNCGRTMPFVVAEDNFKMNNHKNTLQKNFPGGANIVCRIIQKKSTNISSFSDRTVETCNQRNLRKYSMGFQKADSTCGGKLTSRIISNEEEELFWDITSCLHGLDGYGYPKRKLISPEFRFADATWYLLVALARNRMHFGINVQDQNSSNEVFDCSCDISCRNLESEVFKSFDLKFQYDKNVPSLSMSDSFQLIHTKDRYNTYMSTVDQHGCSGVVIVCRIGSKKSTIKEACLRTGVSHYSGSAVEVHNPTRRSESKDDEIPAVNVESKLCQDFKKILVSGEGSDVTIQIRNQSFKAHWSILIARSSVFASMFRQDLKEKVMGVLNVKDCNASSFPVFLEFLYCESTEKLTVENVFSLYATADKYDVVDLKMKCLQFIKINISFENICETILLSLQHSETDLLKFATDFFARNMKDIILTRKWQAFISENPIQGNEILIMALSSGGQCY